MTNLDQFSTKAAGLPEFEIQGMFGKLAASAEPAGGLNMGVSNDFTGEELSM